MPLSTHPVDVGTRSEAAVLSDLVQLGFEVLLPWGHNHRYDLVVDLGHRFVRVQVKTARVEAGCLLFNTQSIRTNSGAKAVLQRYDASQIDVFAAYSPMLRRTYVVPVEDVPSHGRLRLTPTANNQAKGVRWASDYALDASTFAEPGTGLEPVASDLQGPRSTS